MSTVEYTRSNSDIQPIIRLSQTDAGIDLRSKQDYDIKPQHRCLVGTGISMSIPPGYYGRIAPRSGLALKYGIDVLAGVVDAGYRGEICVILYNTDKDNLFHIKTGDRIAQIIIEKYYPMDFVEVEKLDESIRGNSGFGSSGVL